VLTQRKEYGPAAKIFAQGDPATSVMYLMEGVVRLSVLSHAGKEAVVAVLEGALKPADALLELMSRDARPEL